MNTKHYSVNNWTLDYAAGTIVHCQTGEIRRLGEYQLKLLDCLIQHAGEILSRHELTALVWERRVIGDNSLSNAIHALRTALEDDGKKQRVIKTIPKKGYLLDPDYCQLFETKPAANRTAMGALPDPAPAVRSPPTGSSEPPPPVVSPMAPLMPPADTPRFHFQLKWLVTLLLLAGLMLTLCWLLIFRSANDDMVAQEQGRNQYSNIRIFRVAAVADEMGGEDILKFKSSLQIINQKLIARDAWMTIYYRTGELVLNYTFSIETPCASQQLAMTLYHWRTDNQKLADTLYQETRRKLNEMAPCKKP